MNPQLSPAGSHRTPDELVQWDPLQRKKTNLFLSAVAAMPPDRDKGSCNEESHFRSKRKSGRGKFLRELLQRLTKTEF